MANTELVGSILTEKKLTVKEGAQALGVGESTLRRLIRDGVIPILRIGGRILLLASDLEVFLQDRHIVVTHTVEDHGRLPPLPDSVLNSEFIKGLK